MVYKCVLVIYKKHACLSEIEARDITPVQHRNRNVSLNPAMVVYKSVNEVIVVDVLPFVSAMRWDCPVTVHDVAFVYPSTRISTGFHHTGEPRRTGGT